MIHLATGNQSYYIVRLQLNHSLDLEIPGFWGVFLKSWIPLHLFPLKIDHEVVMHQTSFFSFVASGTISVTQSGHRPALDSQWSTHAAWNCWCWQGRRRSWSPSSKSPRQIAQHALGSSANVSSVHCTKSSFSMTCFGAAFGMLLRKT